MACEEERAEIAAVLVEHGANISIQNKVRIFRGTNVKRLIDLKRWGINFQKKLSYGVLRRWEGKKSKYEL